MLTITGEVRKVINSDYKTKDNQLVRQSVLIIEPENSRQNYEVYLNQDQLNQGAETSWNALKGSKASVEVSLFVNHQYKFYKFNAVGNGKPVGVKNGTAS